MVCVGDREGEGSAPEGGGWQGITQAWVEDGGYAGLSLLQAVWLVSI